VRLPPSCRLPLLLILLAGSSAGLQAESDTEKAARFIKTRRYPEAQQLLDRAAQADPRDAEVQALLGELQVVARQPKKALVFFDKAAQLQPGKARYQVLRGSALGMQAQQGNFLKAMTLVGDIRGAFEKAVQLEPKNRNARGAMFEFYFQAPAVAGGGLDRAKAFAEQTVALDPAFGYYLLGMVKEKQKDPGAAQAEYRLSVAADPTYAPVYNRLGYVELAMKQVDAALDHFRKQVELSPENPNSYDSLGDGWKAKGNMEEAIAAYRKALALNPLFFASQRSLGSALEQAGRREEAIQHYRHCAQLGAQEGFPQAVTEAKARLKALGVNE